LDDYFITKLNSKAQVTVEFVLILVIMLAVLATISLQVVDEVTAMIEDSALAVNLAAAQERIVTTAEEVSTGSCGSFKEIGIYIDPSFLSLRDAEIHWNGTHVMGNFTDSTGQVVNLKALQIPYYITIDNQGCNVVRHNTYYIKIIKNCTDPTPFIDDRNRIGAGC